MASTPRVLQSANGARLRLLTIPREHGAWGILLVPLSAGAAIGLHSPTAIPPLILLVLTVLALFCLRTPLESWLASGPVQAQTASERRAVQTSIVAFGALGGAALAALLWVAGDWNLLILGAVAALIFLAQAVLKGIGRASRMTAQLVGALGLTSTAAAAYYVATGNLGASALILWGMNWLFAINQIHFVQLRLHAARVTSRSEKFARGRAFLVGEALSVLFLTVSWRAGYLPAASLLAFVPVFVRGALWIFSPRTPPLEVRRLGLSELAHAIAFGVLLILGFRVGAT